MASNVVILKVRRTNWFKIDRIISIPDLLFESNSLNIKGFTLYKNKISSTNIKTIIALTNSSVERITKRAEAKKATSIYRLIQFSEI